MQTGPVTEENQKMLEAKINALISRRMLMERRREELESGIMEINRRLKALHAKRTIELNLTLPLD